MKSKIMDIVQLIIALILLFFIFRPIGKLIYKGYMYEKNHAIEKVIISEK
jgi:hypothetical protein